MWLETASIAAACVVLLVLGANAVVGEFMNTRNDAASLLVLSEATGFFFLAGCSIMLWWALDRQIKRLRTDVEVDD